MSKKVLDLDGLHYLLVQIKALIEQETQINITTSIDENSTNQQLPGAKAVYDLIIDALAGIVNLSMEVVTELPQIADAETNVIYLIQVDNTVNRYHQWILTKTDQWFDLGITEIDLSNYWSKDELKVMTNVEIQEVFDEVMGD
jgi:hypothetical protein